MSKPDQEQVKVRKQKSNLFQSVNELQQFILWAKEQKIQALAVGDVHITFSVLAFISESTKDITSEPQNEGELQTLLERQRKEEEELLYHSS